jgi:hypothetical protein
MIPPMSFSQASLKSLSAMTNVLLNLIQLIEALQFSMDTLDSVMRSLASEAKKPPVHALIDVWIQATQQLYDDLTVPISHASQQKALLTKIKELCVRYCGLALKEPEMFE